MLRNENSRHPHPTPNTHTSHKHPSPSLPRHTQPRRNLSCTLRSSQGPSHSSKLVAGLPKPLQKDAPREYKVILDTTKEKKLLGLTYHTKEDAVRDTLAGLDLSAGVSLNWGPFKP
ncbi:hypothetical protein NMY22_g13379 [Coprinellus aureogranulatus]|nr:hypothetical protein NMY22_g13379 [Coprinellus aureogranulatus]